MHIIFAYWHYYSLPYQQIFSVKNRQKIEKNRWILLIKKAEEGFWRLLTPLQPLSLTPLNKKFTDFFSKPAKKFAGRVNWISADIYVRGKL